MNEREIFEAALDIIDATHLEQFLSNSCGSDHVLREGVESLLAAHASGSDFRNTPLIQPPSSRMFTEAGPETTQGYAEDDSLADNAGAIDLSCLVPSTKSGSIGTLGHYEVLNVLGEGQLWNCSEGI